MTSTNDWLNLIIINLKARGFKKAVKRYFRKKFYSLRDLPTCIQIEASARCNLKCPYCSAYRDLMEKEGQTDMSLDMFRKVIDDIMDIKSYYPAMQLSFRGEPFLNKNIIEMVSLAGKRGLDVSINTNGVLIKKDVADKLLDAGLYLLTVSFDGASKQTFEANKVGAGFEDVISNIKYLCSEKKRRQMAKPTVELQFIVTKNNESEIGNLKKIADYMGVDNIKLKTLKIPQVKKTESDILGYINKYMPVSTGHQRYMIEKGKLKLRFPSKNCDWRKNAIIYANGSFAICCEDFNEKYDIGDIKTANFWDIWKSEKFRRLRHSAGAKELDICRYC